MAEGNKTISSGDELCRIFYSSFSKTVDELKITSTSNYMLNKTNDPFKEALRYFDNHPSIAKIKRKSFDASLIVRDSNFSGLLNLSKPWIEKTLLKKNDIPAKIIKLDVYFFGNHIFKNFNYCLEKGEFPFALKQVGVAPVHKKKIKMW